MKRFVSVLIVSLLLALCLLPAFALADSIDLSTLSNEELLALWEAVGERLVEVGAYPYIEITAQTFGEPVLRLQKRLAKLYYYTQEPSGQYDKVTSRAFSAFMKQNGKKAGKTVTIEDQQYLYSTAAIPASTPTPPPTPTPEPTPFFLRKPLDLTGVTMRFIEKMSDKTRFKKLNAVDSIQNEFYTIDKWKYDYDDADFDIFPQFTPYIYTWTEHSSGKIIALAFTVDTLVYDDSLNDEYSEVLNTFISELGCSARVRFNVKKATKNYFRITPDKEIYGDQFPMAEFSDSFNIQNYIGLNILYTGIASKLFTDSFGVVIILGVDNRISALPGIEYTPIMAPTPTPENPSTVSAHEFSQVYVGMSYDDVAYTFGSYGYAGSTSKTSSGTFADYTWKSESGGTISITFLDGEVYMASNYK